MSLPEAAAVPVPVPEHARAIAASLASVPILIAPGAPVVPIPLAVHHHLINLGQILGLGMLALQAYAWQDKSPDGAEGLLNPAVANPLLLGIMSLFPKSAP